MFVWILSSLVVSEAIVGIVLTVLLVIGRANPTTVVDIMSFVGFLIFAGGFLPLLQKLRGLALIESPNDKADEESTSTESSESRLVSLLKKQANLLRAMLVGGIVFAMGLGLFYITGGF